MESDFCKKCAQFKGCKKPCRPVELFLKEDNLSTFEKTVIKPSGETISIIFARSREIPETGFEQKSIGEVPTKQIGFWKKKVAERSGSLPKGQKWYLLNKLFGLRPSEIAELEGLDKNTSSDRQLIIRVSDQLKAREISLIETTSQENVNAKARLDSHRQKRRERHAKKNSLC